MNPSEEQKGANASAAGDASSAGLPEATPEVLNASTVPLEPAASVVQPADPLNSYEDGYSPEPEAAPVAAPVRPAPPPRPPSAPPSRAVATISRRPGGGGKTPPPPPPTGGGGGGGDDDDDEGMLRMSFLQHLEELRDRIIRALWGVAIAFVLSL